MFNYFRKELDWGGRKLVLETGKMARQADGAVMVSYGDTGYDTFKNTAGGRLGVVYVGANDGMLHAFRTDTGEELWAYVPSAVLPNLYKLADKQYATQHLVLVAR